MSSEIVLYVDHDHNDPSEYCKGSKICLNILELLDETKINVQDCALLRKKKINFPDWLIGTPTIVISSESVVLKGTDAVNFLREKLDEKRIESKSKDSNEKESKIYDEDEVSEEEEETETPEQAAQRLEGQTKLSQNDVEKYMKERTNQDNKLKT
tara:strand:- start:31 stop:495 length:465 start_codon:yes stop_codon:yes gene_type:complete